MMRTTQMPASSKTSANPSRFLILLVDDHASLRGLMTEVLRLAGQQVITAATAESALAHLRAATPPDVIVTDLNLPGMDGRSLLQAARSVPGLEQIPAVAISGFGERADLEASRAAGFHAHLIKPFDVADLVAAVQQAVRSA